MRDREREWGGLFRWKIDNWRSKFTWSPKIIVIIDHNDLQANWSKVWRILSSCVGCGSKICQVITKKKTVRIVLHKPFFAPLFFRFCLNLNQMLLDSFIYTPMKLNLCGVLLKLSMYYLICSVKEILGLHQHLAQ